MRVALGIFFTQEGMTMDPQASSLLYAINASEGVNTMPLSITEIERLFAESAQRSQERHKATMQRQDDILFAIAKVLLYTTMVLVVILIFAIFIALAILTGGSA